MAYSDYGGFAYRNGIHLLERSDAVLSSEGLKSTPGMWPGILIPEGRNSGSYHVILGDGPLFVCLHKQSTVNVFLLNEKVDLVQFAPPEGIWESDDKTRYIENDYFRDEELPFKFTVSGCEIEIRYTYEDNYYVYVRVVQPDGVIWSGWSGYGVGAGFDGDYGYSNLDRERKMLEFWPDSLKVVNNA